MVKWGKELPKSSRFEFAEKIAADNFTLWNDNDEISGSLIRQKISDSPLFGILENNILVVFILASLTVIFSMTKIGCKD